MCMANPCIDTAEGRIRARTQVAAAAIATGPAATHVAAVDPAVLQDVRTAGTTSAPRRGTRRPDKRAEATAAVPARAKAKRENNKKRQSRNGIEKEKEKKQETKKNSKTKE